MLHTYRILLRGMVPSWLLSSASDQAIYALTRGHNVLFLGKTLYYHTVLSSLRSINGYQQI